MFNIDRKRPCCGARPGAVEPVLFSINERSCRAGAEWRRGLPATPPTSARCDSGPASNPIRLKMRHPRRPAARQRLPTGVSGTEDSGSP